MSDASLLICTRDRGASLDRMLASVTRAAAAATDVALEVVIVDNGSTDDTPARLARWKADQPFAVRLLSEPRAGLARARNRGLATVHGRIVAMTDDDCVLHGDYLTALIAAFAAAGTPAIIGGRILPGDAADLPVTIKLEDHPMRLDRNAFPGGFVMGANLAFTRDVAAIVGRFDERFGAGAAFVSAEDTDFLFRAQARDIAIAYDPHFVVDHHHGRRTPEAAIALLAGYGHGDGALYAKHLLDRRTWRIALRDLRNCRSEHDADQPFAFIPRFHRFRLRHVLRGALAYLRTTVTWPILRPGRPLPLP